jgi:murein DD-endopeptidase MepM/ murein hydrolase activator NlpD
VALLVLGSGFTHPASDFSTVVSFRFPLDHYPVSDPYNPWGALSPYFYRCGMPGKHVAHDARVPNGTDVFAVANGRVTYAAMVGWCQDNWGWVMVTEHTLPDGTEVCAIYGHCRPIPGVAPGVVVTIGQHIAHTDMPCYEPHIHFGIHVGPYDAPDGIYAGWLVGYLPNRTTCPGFPVPFPGDYVDPVRFVWDMVPVESSTWGGVKAVFQ